MNQINKLESSWIQEQHDELAAAAAALGMKETLLNQLAKATAFLRLRKGLMRRDTERQ